MYLSALFVQFMAGGFGMGCAGWQHGAVVGRWIGITFCWTNIDTSLFVGAISISFFPSQKRE